MRKNIAYMKIQKDYYIYGNLDDKMEERNQYILIKQCIETLSVMYDDRTLKCEIFSIYKLRFGK
jgi:hypothetical protein